MKSHCSDTYYRFTYTIQYNTLHVVIVGGNEGMHECDNSKATNPIHKNLLIYLYTCVYL